MTEGATRTRPARFVCCVAIAKASCEALRGPAVKNDGPFDRHSRRRRNPPGRGLAPAFLNAPRRFDPNRGAAATRSVRGARRRPLFQADFRRRGGRHASWLAGAPSLLFLRLLD